MPHCQILPEKDPSSKSTSSTITGIGADLFPTGHKHVSQVESATTAHLAVTSVSHVSRQINTLQTVTIIYFSLALKLYYLPPLQNCNANIKLIKISESRFATTSLSAEIAPLCFVGN